MSNNLPLYPLLRKGRDVDIIVCFDASADIKQENWLSVADGYAKQRGIKGWPVGAGWPKPQAGADQTNVELDAADAATAQQAAGKIAELREERRTNQRDDDYSTTETDSSGNIDGQSNSDLGYCNVWVGTTVERTSGEEPPHSKRVDPDKDWLLMEPDSGLTVVYFPFLANPKVQGVDPHTSSFMSTVSTAPRSPFCLPLHCIPSFFLVTACHFLSSKYLPQEHASPPPASLSLSLPDHPQAQPQKPTPKANPKSQPQKPTP